MSEFDMLVTELKAKECEMIKAIQRPRIMVVTGVKGTMKSDGREVEVKEGYVFFIGFNTEIEMSGE
jgi:mannose-6-phosphate isomerase